MTRSRVAVLKTAPATVIGDYLRLMRLACYQQFPPRDTEIALKINVRRQHFADGDNGHGNATNVIRTIREFERAGVAAIFIEIRSRRSVAATCPENRLFRSARWSRRFGLPQMPAWTVICSSWREQTPLR
jgi:hypothetical protein